MSATAATDCEHDWENTGARYVKLNEWGDYTYAVMYCPVCRKFDMPVVSAIRRATCPTTVLGANLNLAVLKAIDEYCQSWLAAHYPEHVEEEA